MQKLLGKNGLDSLFKEVRGFKVLPFATKTLPTQIVHTILKRGVPKTFAFCLRLRSKDTRTLKCYREMAHREVVI